ncbi:MAG: peptidoglycan-binding protein [Candidatus Omnitrophota bacterium]|jgi:peptidoglycan hydrolase-like protein with peptidoglycan-binding domain|nr:MAG: peptidoglycan-binding protein [Candidatus Omnitrophota bacterium]
MFAKMISFVLFVFVLAGCAMSSKKQPAQSQPAAQELYSRDYGQDGSWLSENYEKPIKKTSSEPAIQLSPKQIQRALKSAGFYQGSVDGKIGPRTKEAIKEFQKARGLKADGVVGKRTSAELNKYLSR